LLAHHGNYGTGNHASGGVGDYTSNAAERLLRKGGCAAERNGYYNRQQPGWKTEEAGHDIPQVAGLDKIGISRNVF
jgi:hypothetical protein